MHLQMTVAAEAFDSATSTFWVTAIVAASLVVVVIAAGALIGLSTIRAVVSPLNRLIVAMGEIANGNYDNRIEIVRRDEIGTALEHLIGMQDKLAQTRVAEQAAAREKERRAARLSELTSGFDTAVSSVLKMVAAASTELQSTAASMSATAEQASAQAVAVATAAEEAGTNVQTVPSASEEQGAATAEIARNVQEAASGTTEVTRNIAGVKEAATDTGAAASQVLAASSELSQQAEGLRVEVESFLAGVRRV